MKAAIFSCKGLGDGLISLLLSSNLYLNGFETDTFHGSLDQMQNLFYELPIKKIPNEDKIDQILKFYDQIFVSYDESSKFIMKLIKDGKDNFVDKVVKDSSLESPSLDFTNKIMSQINATTQSEITIYKPLISKRAWFIIGALIVGGLTYLMFGNNLFKFLCK